jgi:four helix bundle protein
MVNRKEGRLVKSAKDLEVYELAYDLAMRIFEHSSSWPTEEKYALTDQIRRSSRSVCANLRDAWAKRRYPANFLSKITDADAENSETDTWLDFAKDAGCLSLDQHEEFATKVATIGKMLGSILKNYESFCKND